MNVKDKFNMTTLKDSAVEKGVKRAHRAEDGTLVWLHHIVVDKFIDDDPDLSYLESTDGKTEKEVAEDRALLNNYGVTWWTCGIRAEATIYTSTNGKDWLINTMYSMGLWGVGSDAGDAYYDSVADEELATLTRVLRALGFADAEIQRELATEKEARRW